MKESEDIFSGVNGKINDISLIVLNRIPSFGVGKHAIISITGDRNS